MAVVPCFGCVRWDGENDPTEVRVWIHAEESARRATQDVGGTVEHDSSGKRWFRPRKLRRHEFWLCTVCQQLFDRDIVTMERLAQKASAKAG